MIFDNQEEITIQGYNKIVYAYSNKVINKNNDFSFFKNSNILLFDSFIKDNYDFLYTINDLTTKIKKSCFNKKANKISNISTKFTCFCIKQYSKSFNIDLNKCLNKNLANKTKLYIYDKSIDNKNIISSYYKCLINEVEFIQNIQNTNQGIGSIEYFENVENIKKFEKNKMFDNYIDLPVFNFKIDNKNAFRQMLSDVFNNHFYNNAFAQYKEIDIGITYKNKMDLIIIENQYLKNHFKDFLIANICKIKYKKEDNNCWYVSMTIETLTSSIEYDVLYKWFNPIFKDYFGSFDKNNKKLKNLFIVKMYRYINFLIGYYIGKQISDILSYYDINVTYNEENTIRYFGNNFNFYIKDIYNSYGLSIFSKINYSYMLYSKKTNKINNSINTINNYNEIKMSEELFKIFINFQNNFQNNENKKLIKIEDLEPLYKMNLNLFCAIIVSLQEKDAIINNIEFSNNLDNPKDREIINNGFVLKNSFNALLPCQANVFYAAIYELYIKSNKDYDVFKQNYKKFIKKIDIYFELEKIYFNKILKKSQFIFLNDYFENVLKNDFNEIIEAKEYLLYDRSQYLITVIREATRLILENTDFNFSNN